MDRINTSSFPINAALRAYAQSPRINRPGGAPFVKSVQPMRPTAPATSPQPIRQSTRPDTVGKIAPKRSALESSSINELVGGQVESIDLANDVAKIIAPKPITTSAGTYAMYPRASDRNQAATNVAANASLGRSLDLNG